MEYTQWVPDAECPKTNFVNVLILVVMEYTQWENGKPVAKSAKGVLILVVMEYTQWDELIESAKEEVLILVVMEYTQWANIFDSYHSYLKS